MRIAVCDDNAQDIERIKRYTIRMIEYAVDYDFIPKPITEDRLRLLFVKAEAYLNMTNQTFSFSYRRRRYSLKFDEILYLEKKGRQAIIHTKEDTYQTNMNLNEILLQYG